MSELPTSWVDTTVGDLFRVVGGGTPSTGVPEYWQGTIPWLSSADIDELNHLSISRFITEEAINGSATNLVPAGSVIVVTRVGLGKVTVAPTTLCFSQDNQALIFNQEHFDTNYVLHFMSTAVKGFKHISRGTTISGVTKKQLLETEFVLPPRPEQSRIVAEIEKQFTRLDAATAALKRVQANLKRYRASVLKAACEGRLVPTEAELARQERRAYEPADKLLQRILRERRARWEADTLAKMVAVGKPPKDDTWKRKYKEPAAPDTTNLPKLPEGWCWASLGQAFEVCVGATPSRSVPEYWNGPIAWVSSGEVAFCRIASTRETITEFGLHNTSTAIHPPGTVLIGMIGEGKTRGQVAILDIAACNNQNSAAIRVSESGLSPEYIYRFLEGVYDQTRTLSSGNNQPALNKSRVQEIIFPLPPLEEQLRICIQTEKGLSVTTRLEETCINQLHRASATRSSLLNKAFTGSLVAQDPTDEPATVLLERICTERASAPMKLARRTKTKVPHRRKKEPAHA